MNYKMKSCRYDLLDKFFDSVFWSTGMPDGSSWSNIFWSRNDLVRYSGLNVDDKRTVQWAYHQMKDNFDLNRDQMYLYGYKDGLSNKEIDREVSSAVRINRFILNDNTINPSLSDVNHLWQIDGNLDCGHLVNVKLILDFDGHFNTYSEAKKAVELCFDRCHKTVDRLIKFSDYGLCYFFDDGTKALIAIYPIANDEEIKELVFKSHK